MQHGEVVGGKVGSWLVAPHEGVVWTNWKGEGWGSGVGRMRVVTTASVAGALSRHWDRTVKKPTTWN